MANCKISRGNCLAKRATVERGAVFGNFDGLHLGHQSLLEALRAWKSESTQRETLLLSLYPHPLKILKNLEVPHITDIRQNCSLLESFSVDRYHLLRFSQAMSRCDAPVFVEEILLKNLALDFLIVGADARVGRAQSGDPALLSRVFKQHNRQVVVFDFKNESKGTKISSRKIRELIARGLVSDLPALLGRYYSIAGKVGYGEQRGRQMGVRTANMRLGGFVQPKKGVYVTIFTLQGVEYPAITNVGERPTFAGKEIRIETHLLGYSGTEFYGQRCSVAFLQFLREERAFSSVEELRNQIGQDIQKARNFFQHFPGSINE